MLRKMPTLLALMICIGMMSACSQAKNDTSDTTGTIGETLEIEESSQSNETISSTYQPLSDEELAMAITQNYIMKEHTTSQFKFSFTIVDGQYYLEFGGANDLAETIEIPTTETEIFVLVIDGSFIPILASKSNSGITIPSKVFTNAEYSSEIPIDKLTELGYQVNIINWSSNSLLDYSLNAVIIETQDHTPIYTVEDAKNIIYSEIKAQYDKLVAEIDQEGEITLTHTEDRLKDICRDAENYSISQVKHQADFGRYYEFTGSKFGYSIYFNKLTGEIFSDDTANNISQIYIRKGVYSLSNLYW